MKTTKIPFLIAPLLIFLLSPATAQTKKDVVWMHGMNGEKRGTVNLGRYSSTFDHEFGNLDESFAPLSTVQTKSRGVAKIADFLSGAVANKKNIGNVGGDSIIFVGHSLGGMVGKELDIRHNKGERNGVNIAGIITLGAPLSGARLVNAMDFSGQLLSPAGLFVANALYNLGRTVLGAVGGALAVIFGPSVIAAKLFENFIKGKGNNDLFPSIPLRNSPTWNDLKVGSGGYASRRNIATNTPKINIWANIERPVIHTLAENNGFGQSYHGVVNHAEKMAYRYLWVPGFKYFANEALKAHAYFKYTIHGHYTYLVADGVTTERRRISIRTPAERAHCYTEIFSKAERACRGWRWLSWLCEFFVTIWEVTKCVIQTLWAHTEVSYVFPRYPNTDGIVSQYSATAQGQRWKGTAIEAPRTDHAELAQRYSEAEKVLRAIFYGRKVKVPKNDRSVFKLK